MWIKFRFIILASLVWLGIGLHAKPVSVQDSENVAKNWMFLKFGRDFTVRKAPSSALLGSSEQQDKKVRVILLDPKGWVVTSADDVAQPILAYGESPIDLSSASPGFDDWADNAKMQIEDAMKLNHGLATATAQASQKSSEIADAWKRLNIETQQFKQLHHKSIEVETKAESEESQKRSKAETTLFEERPKGAEMLGDTVSGAAIKPLLWMGVTNSDPGGIMWSQETGYNAQCPYDASSKWDSRVLVGCVATAMGQIMRYYKSPSKGSGSHSYTHPTYGTLSANFGSTTYNWSSMPYQLTQSSTGTQINAVSTILYQAGVSVDMDYGVGESGASPSKVSPAFLNYFGFGKSELHQRDQYSGSWDGLLQGELGNRRPLFYVGFKPSGVGGHAFVLDGYDGSGYYHFNWGWDGYQNGFYALSNLTPGTRDYTRGQMAVTAVGSSPVPPPPPPPPPAARKMEVTRLYVATFLRAPDSDGLNYWVDSALSIEGIADSFFDQPETQSKYPPSTTIGEFINKIYANVFNRSPDAAGFDYWVDALYYRKVSPSQFILAVINGARGDDAVILTNKARVGAYYAAAGLNDISFAEYVMRDVDETEQSVQDAFWLIDNH